MLPSQYQQYIHISRYARFDDAKGRRETWEETVARYFDFMEEHLSECHGYTMTKALRDELEGSVLRLEVMPSMRAMMTAGEALKRNHIAAYNCSYLPVDDVKSFSEALLILMHGTGVGFSVERQFVSKLPEVPDDLQPSETIIVVEDSKEGWATALHQLLSMLYGGSVPRWDLRKIRPAGARLKTFGGRASGPGPLEDLFRFCVAKIKAAAGRKLTSIECHDIMCKIGEVVVVGGVRRSAMISLSNLSDDRMRHAKAGQWWEAEPQRALANNSWCATERPDVGVFMSEWTSLFESKSGERGIFNREASKRQAAKYGRRDKNHDFGTNPCCVTGDTYILTRDGHRKISSLVGDEVDVWNGEEWASVTPFETGVWPIYRVNLSDGTYLDCTSNHKFVLQGHKFTETKDLKAGDKLEKFDMPVIEGGVSYPVDAYSQGFYSGDGNGGYSYSWVYEPKYAVIPRLSGPVTGAESYGRRRWDHGEMFPKDFVPINASLDYCLNWFAGLCDADGTVTRDANGNGIQIASVDHSFLNKVRLMLTRLGVRAKVVSAADAGMKLMPNGTGGSALYDCKETRRLLIGNMDTYRLVGMGFKTNRLDIHGNPPQRDARRFVTVESVISLGREEMTYCFEEPKTHRGTFNGIVTGQSEIILRPYQFCNLTEVVVRADDTVESLKRKARLAAILGTFQATLTDFPGLRKVWQRNTREERLLGVSMTGIMDCALTNGREPGLADRLEEIRLAAVQANEEMADALGIERSTAVTAVKPSGTVSQLVDAASGIHARHSAYYIRRVRGDKKDPLTQFLIDAGVPCEDDVMKPDSTVVFSFPVKAPEGAVTRNDMSAIEQLELWLEYQRHYTEHKPSATVSVRDHEWPEVGAWVWKHFDEISGVSFLNHSGHSYRQAPYEECDEETYNTLLAAMPVIDWGLLADYDGGTDNTEGAQTLACTAGGCEL